MFRQRPTHRSGIPVRVGLVALVACFGLAPVVPASAAGPAGPRCDDIDLPTELQDERWRVMREAKPGGPYDPSTLYACDRTAEGAARVISASSYGTLVGLQLSGDRLLVQGVTGFSSGGNGGRVTIVDLPSRRSLTLGYKGWDASPEYTRRPTALTPNGGIATATWSGSYSRPEGPGEIGTELVAEGPLALWNGAALVPGLQPVRSITALPVGAADPSGVYLETADGVRRGSVPRVPTSAFAPGGRLHVLKAPLPGGKASPGIRRTLLAASHRFGTRFELVVEGRGRDAKAWVEARRTKEPGRRDRAVRFALARGAHRALRVLATSEWGTEIAIAARFADGDGRRVRALSFAPDADIDLPATPELERPGRIALGPGVVAVAAGDRIRLWAGGERAGMPIAGPHDLAFRRFDDRDYGGGSDEPLLFATAADGTAARFPLTLR